MDPSKKEDERSSLSESAVAAYDRIVERVYRSVEDLEEHSWPYIKDKIEEAAELELAAREMTREELDLLSAYVKRDISELGRIAHKTGESIAALLKFDLNALEQRVVDMFGLLADPATVDQMELAQRLDHGAETYLAGEVAGVGALRCLSCGQLAVLTETALIEPCHQCAGRYFEREPSPPMV
ncbi:zinc ribbon-containing protein [Motiliproteus sediminis]|uniref:zinc ribbon-containing protein n=1 Tax=Motiliproteus sediminis TaxID=1468178 RepID=UPI001AEF9EC0|nr:metalloendopeptidase [Motiliproteus sediminis]